MPNWCFLEPELENVRIELCTEIMKFDIKHLIALCVYHFIG